MDEIRLHVVPCTNAKKDAAGNPAQSYTVTIQQFTDLIGRVNALFAPADIKFMFDPEFDWTPLANTAINTDSGTMGDQCNAMAEELPGKMLCVLRWGSDPAGQTGNGNAYPPPGAGPTPANVTDFVQNYVALPSGLSGFNLLNQGNGGFVAHEFGHYLGLYHTFPGWNGIDPMCSGVGKNPTLAQTLKKIGEFIAANGGTLSALDGDGLSDTKPDPGPVPWQASGASICTTASYDVTVGSGAAAKTITLKPDPNNIMSYFGGCPDSNSTGPSPMKFSAKQIERMRSTLKHKSRETLTGTPIFGPQSLQIGNAIAPASGRLHLIATEVAGRVWFANWDGAKNGGKWDRWRPVLPVNAACATRVRAVARAPDRLDIFLADQNGRVATGARHKGTAGGKWRGWWDVMAADLPPGGAVAAVSRNPDQLDAFIVGNLGFVYTAAWTKADGAWAGWWQIGTLKAPPGAPVAAVSRGPAELDLLVAGSDGKIRATGWSANANSGNWRPWKAVAAGATAPGGAVSAVSRHPDQLDAFVVGTDGGIYTAAWNKNHNKGEWAGWWRIGTVTAPPGAPVTAVARTSDSLDIFVVGSDGNVYASSWSPAVNNGNWKSWSPVLGGKSHKGSAVTAVARTPAKLDIFVVGTDGGVYTAAWDKQGSAGTWNGWWRLF